MPNTNTLPLGKTPGAAGSPADFSVAGLILPIMQMSPTDSMFSDGMVQDGMLVLEHRTGDGGAVLWTRVDGTWVALAAAPL